MISLFKKKTQKPIKDQSHSGKRSLDSLQDDPTVLEGDKLLKLGGGKSKNKSFDSWLDWNSSCGDTIPQ